MVCFVRVVVDAVDAPGISDVCCFYRLMARKMGYIFHQMWRVSEIAELAGETEFIILNAGCISLFGYLHIRTNRV